MNIKNRNISRILYCCLTIFCCCYSLISHSQELSRTVNISFDNETLAQALKRLETNGQLHLIYTPELVQGYRVASTPASLKTVAQCLQFLLANTHIGFQETGAGIALFTKPTPPPARVFFPVTGYVTDTAGNAVEGASVSVPGKNNKNTVTDSNGRFQLTDMEKGNKIDIGFVGLNAFQVIIQNRQPLNITLLPAPGAESPSLTVNTGYGKVKKDKSPGSYSHAEAELLNRSVATTIFGHMEGTLTGLQFIKNIPNGSNGNESAVTVWGRSTIASNAAPLIIMDDFPYEGSLDNINPADVASITLLKDAAAASIWGAFSGNGVIVITTRKGELNKGPRTSLTSNFTYLAKPNLRYIPALSAQRMIEVEQYLFRKNYYDLSAGSSAYLSSAVAIMAGMRNGSITSSADSAAQMQQLAATDTRAQLARYFYRPGFQQQYALSLSGGTDNSTYYMSAGFDRNLQQLVRNSYDRFTWSTTSTHLLARGLQLGLGMYVTQSYTRFNNNGGPFIRPYDALVLPDGSAAVVPVGYRQSFKNNADSRLLNWDYKPVNDLNNSNNITRQNDYRATVQLSYKPVNVLEMQASYQYYSGQSRNENIRSQDMYEVRNLINIYSQLRADGAIDRPVPLGGIADIGNYSNQSHILRGLVRATLPVHRKGELLVMAGYDVRMLHMTNYASRLFGYNSSNHVLGLPVNLDSSYKPYVGQMALKIPGKRIDYRYDNNFVSRYASLTYTHGKKWSALLSYRVDKSNLFGSTTNSRGMPLWAAGLGYTLTPQLKLRGSIGVSGNVNTSLTAYNSAVGGTTRNRFGSEIATVNNPANPNLRWEKLRTINAGIEFKLLRGRLSGTLEGYRKDGSDLIEQITADPTSGFASYTGNYAGMRTLGADLSLSLLGTARNINWNTTLLLSYTKDKVTQVYPQEKRIIEMLSIGQLNPMPGYPLYSLYSFRVNKLNNTGNPVVLFKGQETVAYNELLTSTDTRSLQYSGPVNPTWYGSIRQSFSWKRFSLNLLLTFKGGHYFRRPGLNYSNLFQNLSLGTDDIDKRWQKAGDEAHTTVPGLDYPASAERDAVYNNSTLLIEPAAHIRFKDVQFAYQLTRQQFPKLPFTSLKMYLYLNNLGILWRANKVGIDPDYVPYGAERILPDARTIGLGMNFIF